MSGFWQNQQPYLGGGSSNPGLNMLINQALLGNPSQPLYGTHSNDLATGSAFGGLNSSGRGKQSGYNINGKGTVTKSVITLPPSLAKRRQEATVMTNADPQPQMSNLTSSGAVNSPIAGNIPLNSAPSKYPQGSTMNHFTAQTNFVPSNASQSDSDASIPAFSTELARGKELAPLVKVSEPPRVAVSQNLILDPTNTQQKQVPFSHHRELYDNDYWHKVNIIGGANMDKEKVLKRILEAAEPSLLLPVMYHSEGEDSVFYARNCGTSVERLCKRSLTLELDGAYFGLRVHLKYAPSHKLRINVLNLIHRMVERRWSESESCLDLTDFQHDPKLEPYIFCPLSQPGALHYVLLAAISHPIPFVTLRLCRNGIRQLKVEVLLKAVHLRTLDLSHNELLYRADLKGIKDLRHMTGVLLDGNPVCAEFRTPEEYIGFLKSLVPQLKSLDGVALFCGSMVMPKEQNFLCSRPGHQLVDQFLKHFFDRYDWSDRLTLDGVYHNDAIFTLTCCPITQGGIESTNLAFYMNHSHNLKKLSDYSKVDKLVYQGSSEILELFCSFPASEHDPYSFCVDLIYLNDKQAVISVTGVFRELPSLPPDPKFMLSFHRVFVLYCVAPNEWQITNEKLHISNVTTQQAESSFKKLREPLQPPLAAWLVQDAELLSQDEKDQMASIMVQLTTLNKEWATKYLTENHWYMREALITFVSQYEAKTIPNEAFVK